MKISREIKTALLVISGIILFIYGFSFLKGTSLLERDKTIFTVYDEVEGLVPGAKVTINGLSVGKISKIDFLSNSYENQRETDQRQLQAISACFSIKLKFKSKGNCSEAAPSRF